MTRADRLQSGALIPVPIRLSPSVWERYSAEATALGKGLSTYLRERLEQQDQLVAELAALRRAVERSTQRAPQASTEHTTITDGALVEMLLHLRSLVGPQKATMAQKEVERRGLQIWS